MQKTTQTSPQKDQRRVKNLLLQPLLQIKLGLYSILLTAIFSAAILAILYFSMRDFAEIVITLTDSESEVRELFFQYASSSRWWIGLLVIGFLGSSILISISYTHKLVGPSIAFANHIKRLRSGDYSKRVILRDGDAFKEVADELNLLTVQLSQTNDK